MPRTDPTMTSLRMNQFYKTKTCPWYFKGRCERGESCRFAHSDREKRDLPDLSRTSFCPTLLKQGSCQTPHCRFAHNVDQLRATNDMYKTSLCFMFMKSRCEAGSQCRHAHGSHELRAPPAALSSHGVDELPLVSHLNPPHGGKPSHQSSRFQDSVSNLRQRSGKDTSVQHGRNGLDCEPSSLAIQARPKGDNIGRAQRQSRKGHAGRNSTAGLNAVREGLNIHQTERPRRASLPDLSRDYYDRLEQEDNSEKQGIVPSQSNDPFLLSGERASSIWPGTFTEYGLPQRLESKGIEAMLDAEQDGCNRSVVQTSDGTTDSARKLSRHPFAPDYPEFDSVSDPDIGDEIAVPLPRQRVVQHQESQRLRTLSGQQVIDQCKRLPSHSRECSPSCPPRSVNGGSFPQEQGGLSSPSNGGAYSVALFCDDPGQGQGLLPHASAPSMLPGLLTTGVMPVECALPAMKTYVSSTPACALPTRAWTLQDIATDIAVATRQHGMTVANFGTLAINSHPEVTMLAGSVTSEHQADLLSSRLVSRRDCSRRESLSVSGGSEDLEEATSLLLHPSGHSTGPATASNRAEENAHVCTNEEVDFNWLPLLSDMSGSMTRCGMTHRRASCAPSAHELTSGLLEFSDGLKSGCTTAATTTTTTPTAGLSRTGELALIGGQNPIEVAASLNWVNKYSAFTYTDPLSPSSQPESMSGTMTLHQHFLCHSQSNEPPVRFSQGDMPQETAAPVSPTLPDLLHQIEAEQRDEGLRWDETRTPRDIHVQIGEDHPRSPRILSPVWLEGRAAAVATASPSELWTTTTGTIARTDLQDSFLHWPLSLRHPLGQPQLI